MQHRTWTCADINTNLFTHLCENKYGKRATKSHPALYAKQNQYSCVYFITVHANIQTHIINMSWYKCIVSTYFISDHTYLHNLFMSFLRHLTVT